MLQLVTGHYRCNAAREQDSQDLAGSDVRNPLLVTKNSLALCHLRPIAEARPASARAIALTTIFPKWEKWSSWVLAPSVPRDTIRELGGTMPEALPTPKTSIRPFAKESKKPES
jgi:hypothetical protein